MAAAAHRGLGARGAAILAVILALLAGWLYLGRRHGPPLADQARAPARGVLDAVPRNAMLVVRLDVTALRKTEVGQRLLGHGRSIAGLGEIGTICGADPMDGVRELAVAIPGRGIDAGFGVFATGALDATALLDCAARVVEQRGGRPVRQRRGDVEVLSDAGGRLSTAELAVAPGGPLVLAEPDYLGRSLAVLAGRAPSVLARAAHAELRQALPAGVLVATAVFTAEQRSTLASELRAQGMSDSPFAAVGAAAMSIRLGAALSLDAVMRCADATSCRAIASQLDRARAEQAARPLTRALGFAEVLSRLRVRAEGELVRVRLSLPTDRALRLVGRLAGLARAGNRPSPAAPPSADVALPLASPPASAPPPQASASPRAGASPAAPAPSAPRRTAPADGATNR